MGKVREGRKKRWQETRSFKRNTPANSVRRVQAQEICQSPSGRQGMLQSPRFLDLQLLTVYSTQTLCTVTYLTWAIWTVVNLPCGHFARESFVRFSQEPIKRSLQQKNCKVIFVKSHSHIIQIKEEQHCIPFFCEFLIRSTGLGNLSKMQNKLALNWSKSRMSSLMKSVLAHKLFDLQSISGFYGNPTYFLLVWTISKHPRGYVNYLSLKTWKYQV